MKTIAATTRAILGLTLLGGCFARSDFGPQDWLVRDAIPTHWGDYAATLDIPDCPSGNLTLTVNTTADELDGGEAISSRSEAGSLLSLQEALRIAFNRNGPETIFFDAEVFPAESPQTLTGGLTLYFNLTETCIDARRRGVILRDYGLPVFDTGTLVVGLAIMDLRQSLQVSGAQIAGCRLGTDGHETGGVQNTNSDELLNCAGCLVGPGNVVAGSGYGLRFRSYGAVARFESNDFGYDPVSGERLNLDVCIVVDGAGSALPPIAVEIRDNLLLCSVGVLYKRGFNFPGSVLFADNFVGVHRDGQLALPPTGGITYLYGGHYVVRDNIIRGVPVALEIGASLLGTDGSTEISQNRIYGNQQGIVAFGAAATLLATITTASTSAVHGTCAQAGTIEVFSDAGDQGEDFLGSASCDGVSEWVLPTSVPSGRNVTATLTVSMDAVTKSTGPFSTPVTVP